MLKIYHARHSRSVRPIWVAEEMGLKYEVHTVQRLGDPAVQQINPMGALPVLEDGGVRIIELLAIMDYIMDRYGPTPLKPKPSDAAYPAYIQFFHFGEATLGARCRNFMVSRFTVQDESQRENWATADSERGFFTGVEMIAQRLREAPYLGGDQFTAADISCTQILTGAVMLLNCKERYGDAIGDYLRRVTERPAYVRASQVS